MSISLLRTSLRSGQPSVARGLFTTAIRAETQPLKTVHPADVAKTMEHESPRELAAEVISDAPSMFGALSERWTLMASS
jgi:hypothetical protein